MIVAVHRQSASESRVVVVVQISTTPQLFRKAGDLDAQLDLRGG
jgi:hypothetical protein